jgi:hypothetical protein
MSLPLVVHERLARLTEAASAVAPSRAELVAMLIADADLDPGQLERAVMAYRKKTVGDVLPPDSIEGSNTQVVQIRTPGPGRPPRVR